MAFRATTIWMVVQLGLAMMPRGRSLASAALTSGTTRGTSASMRKALELSIITASANSFDVPAPAEVKAMSTPLKSSLCCKSLTSICLPRKVYLVPALRLEPNKTNSSNGKFLSSSTRRNSCPTAPLAPTIATFISFSSRRKFTTFCDYNHRSRFYFLIKTYLACRDFWRRLAESIAFVLGKRCFCLRKASLSIKEKRAFS